MCADLAQPAASARQEIDTLVLKPEASQVKAAPRTGRFVKLVPVTPEYRVFLYELAVDEESGFRWRFNGSVPPPEVFQESLWSGVLCQFVVVETVSGSAQGTAVAYSADLNHGYCYVGIAMSGDAQNTGLAVEAFLLFTGHLFATYRLRKLYMDIPEYNMRPLMSAVGTVLTLEGRLKDHNYYGGRYWDRLYFAVYPDSLAGIRSTD